MPPSDPPCHARFPETLAIAIGIERMDLADFWPRSAPAAARQFDKDGDEPKS
jgi:hypothetical protein